MKWRFGLGVAAYVSDLGVVVVRLVLSANGRYWMREHVFNPDHRWDTLDDAVKAIEREHARLLAKSAPIV